LNYRSEVIHGTVLLRERPPSPWIEWRLWGATPMCWGGFEPSHRPFTDQVIGYLRSMLTPWASLCSTNLKPHVTPWPSSNWGSSNSLPIY